MREAGYNVDSRQLLICNTEVNGLISGPSWLRQSLVADFEALGYVRNPYDKCIMTLPSQTPGRTTVEGVVLIEVDDILEGGTAVHRARMDLFYKKYKCGNGSVSRSFGPKEHLSAARV